MLAETTLHRFRAPWCPLAKIVTVGVGLLLTLPPVLAWFASPRLSSWMGLTLIGPLILIVTWLFAVHGYRLTNGVLWVERPLWSSRLVLAGLRAAEADPGALEGSLRLFASGGLFGFFGWFWNRRLGRYSAYVTDPKRAVVLRFNARRPLVVSPDDPAAFVRLLGGDTTEKSTARTPVN